MILDSNGKPIPSTIPPVQEKARRPLQLPGANPSVGDVWHAGQIYVADGSAWVEGGRDPTGVAGLYGVNRREARQLTREMYYTPNPLFQAAVNLVAALLVGDSLSYGQITDKAVRDTVEEFWQLNAFGEFITQRFIIEFLLDGEAALVWNKDAIPEVTARVSALDVHGGLEVHSNTARGLVAADMAERLVVRKNQKEHLTWEEGQFVWVAYGAMHNDARGYPPTLAAAMASAAFVNLVNSRLRVNELLGRLLAVYKAFLNPDEPDGGLASWLNKARAFREVPEDGTVVPLITKPGYSVTEQDMQGRQVTKRFDGVSESLEFPSASPGASDAASDMRVVMRLVGVTLGLPEHYLGEGGNATRTTADSMTLPAVMTIKRLQAYVRGFMDRTIRTELKRKYGPDRLYTVYEMAQDESGLKRRRRRKRVPADLLEIPWVLPSISQHSLEELLKLAEAAEKYGWASSQTLSSGFGFDTAAEAELMAANGQAFGGGRQMADPTTTTATGGNDETTTSDGTPEPTSPVA